MVVQKRSWTSAIVCFAVGEQIITVYCLYRYNIPVERLWDVQLSGATGLDCHQRGGEECIPQGVKFNVFYLEKFGRKHHFFPHLTGIDKTGAPTDRFGEYLFGRAIIAYDFRIKV